jgi:hypothetical protein
MHGHAENFWDGATLYVRFEPDEPWQVFPFFGAEDWPPGSSPYSSPLWLLDALCGAAVDARVVASETLRGIDTTRIRLKLNPATANAASPAGLQFPARHADTFPAEAWVDDDGRLPLVSVFRISHVAVESAYCKTDNNRSRSEAPCCLAKRVT